MKTFCAVTAIALSASNAVAQDAGDLSIALGISTLGTNLEAAYRIDPSYRMRGAFIGGFDVSYDESDADAEFEGDIELGGLMLLGDFYPLQNGWRVSGGLFFSNSELNATGTADIDGVGTEAVTTTAAFNSDVAPMITTGYDVSMGSGWSFNSEVGVIFTGGVDLEFTAENPAFQDDVDDDPDLQEAKADAEDLIAYPYLGLSVSYRF